MQPAAIRPEREDQRREILSRGGLSVFLSRDVEPLRGVPQYAIDNLVADLLIRYHKVVGFAEDYWRDMPIYGTLRRRHGEVVAKALLAMQRLPKEERLGYDRMVTWSKNKPKVEASLRKYCSHALTELIKSLVATFRCLTEEGKTDKAYDNTCVVLEKAGVPTVRRLRRREGDDAWSMDAVHQRVIRGGRMGKVEEIGEALITTDAILRVVRTGRKPPDLLVQAQGRYYRALP